MENVFLLQRREISHKMGESIVVVSGKGGTGKTSFTASVGSALSLMGKQVVCLDCDIGLRNLDLSLGLTDRALMDFTDVALGEPAVQHPRLPNLYLLTAPMGLGRETVTGADMYRLLAAIKARFDYCLIDAPAGLGSGFRLASCAADRAVVVTTTDPSSLRDAQHTVMLLDGQFPQNRLHLVVNRVRKKLLRSLHATIDDAIDTAGLPLLGVVPEDDALPISLGRGIPLMLSDSSLAPTAYRNIAKRITGVRVPLMRIK